MNSRYLNISNRPAGNFTVAVLALLCVFLMAEMALPAPSMAFDGMQQAQQVAVSEGNPAEINTIYGNRTTYVGEEENYRVRVKEGATWPISYSWDMGDGTKTEGNNVVHWYHQPGLYEVKVVVSNEYGSDKGSVWIRVLESIPIVEEEAEIRSREESARRTAERDEAVRNATVQPETDTYYSWIAETHLEKMGADNAARNYQKLDLSQVRVYTDTNGRGSTAYRVLIGTYSSESQAVGQKKRLEELLGHPLSLITIWD